MKNVEEAARLSDPNEPLDCSGCNHCCNFLMFFVNSYGETIQHQKEIEDFYEKRGVLLKKTPTGYVATVEFPCPYVTEKGCHIHTSKPETCRRYDCRLDACLPPGGKYNEQ